DRADRANSGLDARERGAGGARAQPRTTRHRRDRRYRGGARAVAWCGAAGGAVVTARGLIIAAARSGAGQATVTLAILAALARRGVKVRAAKAGPDYIDPAFHAVATGAPGINLDSWAMSPPLIDALIAEAARAADLLVIEGVMGLFDGVPGARGRTGATADLAARLQLSVLLVLDVAGQSQSAAAVARGFALHD